MTNPTTPVAAQSTAEPSVEQRAREMLAVEVPQHLRHIVLTAPMAELGYSFQYALRAITKALQSTDEVVEALTLARNRLQMCAITATAEGMNEQDEWSEWAEEITALLAKLKGQSE